MVESQNWIARLPARVVVMKAPADISPSHHHSKPAPRQLPLSTAALRATLQPSMSVIIDSDRSSRFPQNVGIPPSTRTNAGDAELPTANGTSIGHADTNLNKTFEELVPDPVDIQPSVEEGEEGAQEESVSHDAESDKGDGLHDVSLNDVNPNVSFCRYINIMKLRKTPRLLLL